MNADIVGFIDRVYSECKINQFMITSFNLVVIKHEIGLVLRDNNVILRTR